MAMSLTEARRLIDETLGALSLPLHIQIRLNNLAAEIREKLCDAYDEGFADGEREERQKHEQD